MAHGTKFSGFSTVAKEPLPKELVRAILGAPRTVAIVLGFRTTEPCTTYEVEDHNQGVELSASLANYLVTRTPRSIRYLKQLWQHPRMASLRQEVETLDRSRAATRDGERHSFERLNGLRSCRFAETIAETLEREQEKIGTKP